MSAPNPDAVPEPTRARGGTDPSSPGADSSAVAVTDRDPANAGEGMRTTADLEAEICELWGHLNAGTYRFLQLLAEFDRAQGWVGAGVANLAQWLNWQCGIGAVAAREKVRVARALELLPKISEAFRLGQLSYSKVRAMTRIATPELEDTLLNVALHGTAAQMEQLVRKFRWVERIEATEKAHAAYRERTVEFRRDEDDSVVLYARLPVELAALVEKAIETAVDSLEAAEQAAAEQAAAEQALAESGDGVTASTDRARSQAVAVEATADETGSNVSAETSISATAVAESESGDAPARAVMAPVLSGEEAAASRAVRRADGLIRLAEHFLETEDGTSGLNPSPRYELVVHIDEQLLREAECAESDAELLQSQNPLRSELDEGAALAAATARRLGCDAGLVGVVENAAGEPLSVGRRSRAIPAGIRRALRARDGGCRFPGCERRRFTEGHHIEHWANGGETSLDNLVTLCHFHHHLVHEGGFAVENAGDNRFVFRDPRGRVVPANGRLRIGHIGELDGHGGAGGQGQPRGKADVGLGQDDSGRGDRGPIGPDGERAARRRWRERALYLLNDGLDIDADTARSRWTGERLDYGWVVGDLFEDKYPNALVAEGA